MKYENSQNLPAINISSLVESKLQWLNTQTSAGLAKHSMNLFDNYDKVTKASDMIIDSSLDFVTEQIKVGADCISIGKASQKNQVLSGNSDTVSVIQSGTEADIFKSVESCLKSVNGRCIVSTSCEIPPETSFKILNHIKKQHRRWQSCAENNMEMEDNY